MAIVKSFNIKEMINKLSKMYEKPSNRASLICWTFFNSKSVLKNMGGY
jgi:hypothetical protein